VNNLAVLSDVARGYAPPGRSLVSVTVVTEPGGGAGGAGAGGPAPAHGVVRRPGHPGRPSATTGSTHAQPLQTPDLMTRSRRPVRLDDGVFVCGDHREHASLNGALASGGRAAREVHRALS
jgi:hypothetical protein